MIHFSTTNKRFEDVPHCGSYDHIYRVFGLYKREIEFVDCPECKASWEFIEKHIRGEKNVWMLVDGAGRDKIHGRKAK